MNFETVGFGMGGVNRGKAFNNTASRARCKHIGPMLVMVIVLASASNATAQGILLPFAGPVNQSMGGASTAAPLDAAGAMFWNPGSISGLQCSELSMGLGLLLPTTSVSSTVPGPVTGTTQSQPGVAPIPTMAYVQKIDDSAWTWGIGVFTLGGFSTNYPASLTNPVLTPQPGGLGAVNAMSQLYQLAPTLSCAVTERLSIGVTPTLSFSYLDINPVVLAAPNAGIYSPGYGTRVTFGGGINLGAYYIVNDNWNLGFTVKSPQWFEPTRINSQTPTGLPTQAKLDFQLPMVMSWGVAYKGFQRTIIDCDLRFVDYWAAHGFAQKGFLPDGAVAGLGWQSVFALAVGAQYLLNDRWTLRIGYNFNGNPIPASQSEFNIASPLIYQHILSCGFSVKIARNVAANLAYSHAFQNSITGPLYSPLIGAIPGTSVTNTESADLVQAGLSVFF